MGFFFITRGLYYKNVETRGVGGEVGRAPVCHGKLSGFESRHPLEIINGDTKASKKIIKKKLVQNQKCVVHGKFIYNLSKPHFLYSYMYTTVYSVQCTKERKF
jgi:hypothetical protein